MLTNRVVLIASLGLSSIWLATDATQAKGPELPAAAAAAVESLYPNARILEVGLEREQGVAYYEVAVSEGGQALEIEVAEDGTIGEIEMEVALGDLPGAARETLLRSSAGASPGRIERHEVRGVPKDGRFAPVEPPLVFFEARVETHGVSREIRVTAQGVGLPAEEEEGDAQEAADLDSDDDGD